VGNRTDHSISPSDDLLRAAHLLHQPRRLAVAYTPRIAAVAIVGVIIGASFFWITTLISIVDVGAPFRTPTSRFLPAYLGLLCQKLTSAFGLFSRKRVIFLFQASRKKITSPTQRLPNGTKSNATRRKLCPFTRP
jgi:hypothetical protein